MAVGAVAMADEPADAKKSAREQHAAEIEYWTSKYDGADLSSGQFNCKAPSLPTMSRNNRAIKTVETSVANWKECYNGFVSNLNDAMPPGKRIPAEIAKLMTAAEMEQAKAHLNEVYARVGAEASASADKTMAAYEKWSKSTEAYVRQSNSQSEDEEHKMDLMRDNAQRGAAPPVRN
ncbi:hypothetical protein [Massilia horti]|nr:hypothetical protein [Massilia horti]